MHKTIKLKGFELNEKEIQFLRLCCSQMDYKQIAKKMKKSSRTIDGYRDDLFIKLKLTNRVGLALFAIKVKLVKVKNIKL